MLYIAFNRNIYILIGALVLLGGAIAVKTTGRTASPSVESTSCWAISGRSVDDITIKWSLIVSNTQKTSCFRELSNLLSKDDLVAWLKSEGFSVARFPIRETFNDSGEMITATWPIKKRGHLTWASGPFAYAETIWFQYDADNNAPSINSALMYL